MDSDEEERTLERGGKVRGGKYGALRSDLASSLAAFDRAQDWADLIHDLQRVNRVLLKYSPPDENQYAYIPDKTLLAKRLCQCVTPSLPSGVHLKAMETYHLVFGRIGPKRLAKDLALYSSGLFPLLAHAATPLKVPLFSLYETYVIPLGEALRDLCGGLVVAFLPALEDESSEFYPRALALLERLRLAVNHNVLFMSVLWRTVLTVSSLRLIACNYIRSLIEADVLRAPVKPSIPTTSRSSGGADSKARAIIPSAPLVQSAFCAAFEDPNVLVKRAALDLLISTSEFDLAEGSLFQDSLIEESSRNWLTSDPSISGQENLDTNALQPSSARISRMLPGDDVREKLIRSVLYVLVARELSLSKRVLSWLVGFRGSEADAERFFEAHVHPFVIRNLETECAKAERSLSSNEGELEYRKGIKEKERKKGSNKDDDEDTKYETIRHDLIGIYRIVSGLMDRKEIYTVLKKEIGLQMIQVTGRLLKKVASSNLSPKEISMLQQDLNHALKGIIAQVGFPHIFQQIADYLSALTQGGSHQSKLASASARTGMAGPSGRRLPHEDDFTTMLFAVRYLPLASQEAQEEWIPAFVERTVQSFTFLLECKQGWHSGAEEFVSCADVDFGENIDRSLRAGLEFSIWLLGALTRNSTASQIRLMRNCVYQLGIIFWIWLDGCMEMAPIELYRPLTIDTTKDEVLVDLVYREQQQSLHAQEEYLKDFKGSESDMKTVPALHISVRISIVHAMTTLLGGMILRWFPKAKIDGTEDLLRHAIEIVQACAAKCIMSNILYICLAGIRTVVDLSPFVSPQNDPSVCMTSAINFLKNQSTLVSQRMDMESLVGRPLFDVFLGSASKQDILPSLGPNDGPDAVVDVRSVPAISDLTFSNVAGISIYRTWRLLHSTLFSCNTASAELWLTLHRRFPKEANAAIADGMLAEDPASRLRNMERFASFWNLSVDAPLSVLRSDGLLFLIFDALSDPDYYVRTFVRAWITEAFYADPSLILDPPLRLLLRPANIYAETETDSICENVDAEQAMYAMGVLHNILSLETWGIRSMSGYRENQITQSRSLRHAEPTDRFHGNIDSSVFSILLHSKPSVEMSMSLSTLYDNQKKSGAGKYAAHTDEDELRTLSLTSLMEDGVSYYHLLMVLTFDFVRYRLHSVSKEWTSLKADNVYQLPSILTSLTLEEIQHASPSKTRSKVGSSSLGSRGLKDDENSLFPRPNAEQAGKLGCVAAEMLAFLCSAQPTSFVLLRGTLEKVSFLALKFIHSAIQNRDLVVQYYLMDALESLFIKEAIVFHADHVRKYRATLSASGAGSSVGSVTSKDTRLKISPEAHEVFLPVIFQGMLGSMYSGLRFSRSIQLGMLSKDVFRKWVRLAESVIQHSLMTCPKVVFGTVYLLCTRLNQLPDERASIAYSWMKDLVIALHKISLRLIFSVQHPAVDKGSVASGGDNKLAASSEMNTNATANIGSSSTAIVPASGGSAGSALGGLLMAPFSKSSSSSAAATKPPVSATPPAPAQTSRLSDDPATASTMNPFRFLEGLVKDVFSSSETVFGDLRSGMVRDGVRAMFMLLPQLVRTLLVKWHVQRLPQTLRFEPVAADTIRSILLRLPASKPMKVMGAVSAENSKESSSPPIVPTSENDSQPSMTKMTSNISRTKSGGASVFHHRSSSMRWSMEQAHSTSSAISRLPTSTAEFLSLRDHVISVLDTLGSFSQIDLMASLLCLWSDEHMFTRMCPLAFMTDFTQVYYQDDERRVNFDTSLSIFGRSLLCVNMLDILKSISVFQPQDAVVSSVLGVIRACMTYKKGSQRAREASAKRLRLELEYSESLLFHSDSPTVDQGFTSLFLVNQQGGKSSHESEEGGADGTTASNTTSTTAAIAASNATNNPASTAPALDEKRAEHESVYLAEVLTQYEADAVILSALSFLSAYFSMIPDSDAFGILSSFGAILQVCRTLLTDHLSPAVGIAVLQLLIRLVPAIFDTEGSRELVDKKSRKDYVMICNQAMGSCVSIMQGNLKVSKFEKNAAQAALSKVKSSDITDTRIKFDDVLAGMGTKSPSAIEKKRSGGRPVFTDSDLQLHYAMLALQAVCEACAVVANVCIAEDRVTTASVIQNVLAIASSTVKREKGGIPLRSFGSLSKSNSSFVRTNSKVPETLSRLLADDMFRKSRERIPGKSRLSSDAIDERFFEGVCVVRAVETLHEVSRHEWGVKAVRRELISIIDDPLLFVGRDLFVMEKLMNVVRECLSTDRSALAQIGSGVHFGNSIFASGASSAGGILDGSGNNSGSANSEGSAETAAAAKDSKFAELAVNPVAATIGSIGKVLLGTSSDIDIDPIIRSIMRIAFTVFCAPRGVYNNQISFVLERLRDSFRLGSALLNRASFFCIRVLLIRVAPSAFAPFRASTISELFSILSDPYRNPMDSIAALQFLELVHVTCFSEFGHERCYFFSERKFSEVGPMAVGLGTTGRSESANSVLSSDSAFNNTDGKLAKNASDMSTLGPEDAAVTSNLPLVTRIAWDKPRGDDLVQRMWEQRLAAVPSECVSSGLVGMDPDDAAVYVYARRLQRLHEMALVANAEDLKLIEDQILFEFLVLQQPTK